MALPYPSPEISVTCPEGHHVAECTRRHFDSFAMIRCPKCSRLHPRRDFVTSPLSATSQTP